MIWLGNEDSSEQNILTSLKLGQVGPRTVGVN